MQSKHQIGIILKKCDQCDSQFSDKRNLNKHKLKVHGIGRWISCDLCDSANEHAIYKREQFVHKRLRFSCDECDFQYTQENKLKEHKQTKHEGIKFICAECKYEGNSKSRFSNHVLSRHRVEDTCSTSIRVSPFLPPLSSRACSGSPLQLLRGDLK